jgi:demethylmenaquinone methyltransferase/2-methoxy-6-polyprenyl-1,4-benzoquinol methylase
MRTHKGNVFEGLHSGATYDRLALMSGFTKGLYNKAATHIPLQAGMHVLDLGCGTGSFGLAIARHIGPTGKVYGVDLSQDQISHAMHKASKLEVPFEFHQCSIDDLPFENGTFDAVISSMTFHEVPSKVRRGAIHEMARVLKPGGVFALVDVSKPQAGVMGMAGWLWFASQGPDPALDDHWNNRYPAMCREYKLHQIGDVYLNAAIRCQVFRKEQP